MSLELSLKKLVKKSKINEKTKNLNKDIEI